MCDCILDAREHDAHFSSMPVPDGRLLGGLPRSILQYPEGQNSLVAGKNAGNFADSAVFRENTFKNICEFSNLQDEFPVQSSKESIRANRE
jgi:hypothetical protein